MIRLGIWQWHVGGARHGDLRNYAYACQWWAFCGFAAFFWWRLMRDARRPAEPPPATEATHSQHQYRRYAMPQSTEIDSSDDVELSQYNAYLRSLDQR